MSMKFNIGDRIARIGYEKFSSERLTILGIVSDLDVFNPSLWYITMDDRGDRHSGLVRVVDGCFHKIDN